MKTITRLFSLSLITFVFVIAASAATCAVNSGNDRADAGRWDLSGEVTTSDGEPIKNATVTVTGGGLAAPVSARTDALGCYRFNDLPGASYTVTVRADFFNFDPAGKTVDLVSDITNANFNARPGLGFKPSGKKGQDKSFPRLKKAENDPCAYSSAAICRHYVFNGKM